MNEQSGQILETEQTVIDNFIDYHGHALLNLLWMLEAVFVTTLSIFLKSREPA